jgi:hypothetical protein
MNSVDPARLIARAEAAGAARVDQLAVRLANQDWPPGVRAEATADGVLLTGRGLKLRIVRDPSIGRLLP